MLLLLQPIQINHLDVCSTLQYELNFSLTYWLDLTISFLEPR